MHKINYFPLKTAAKSLLALKIIIIASTLLITDILIFSCKSICSEKLVYMISDCEITRDTLEFTLKNTSLKSFSSFVLYVEFSSSAFENYDSDLIIVEKEVISEIESNDSKNFSIDLSEENLPFDEFRLENENAYFENSTCIQNIFIKEIRFEDGSVFSDKYGSWSF